MQNNEVAEGIEKEVTVTVYTRHSADCDGKNQKDDCPKWLYIHNPGDRDRAKRKQRISAGTRSWAAAVKKSVEVLDSFDPAKRELKRLTQERKMVDTRILDALNLFYDDLRIQNIGPQTINNYQTILGKVDKQDRVRGNLLNWLERTNRKAKEQDRIDSIGQLTPLVITQWRNSWQYNDLTSSASWKQVKTFFKWCKQRKLIPENPCEDMKGPKVRKGNRCGYFDEEQYNALVLAATRYRPSMTPRSTRETLYKRHRSVVVLGRREVIAKRTVAFIEWCRWSGQAIMDACLFKMTDIDADGILRYHRKKTGELAVVAIPQHVLTLLDGLPLEDGGSEGQPFGSTHVSVSQLTQRWRRRFQEVCMLAGIDEVKTQVGYYINPHPHMLRDTCAIWYLQHGKSLEDVARILGHSDIRTTQKHYGFWVAERDKAMIARIREAQAHIQPIREATTGAVIDISQVRERR